MKNGIEAGTYYKLLEWKGANIQDFIKVYGEVSLDSLTVMQLQEMHIMITENELW